VLTQNHTKLEKVTNIFGNHISKRNQNNKPRNQTFPASPE